MPTIKNRKPILNQFFDPVLHGSITVFIQDPMLPWLELTVGCLKLSVSRNHHPLFTSGKNGPHIGHHDGQDYPSSWLVDQLHNYGVEHQLS